MAGIWADIPSGSHGLYGTNATAMKDGIWSDIGGSGQIFWDLIDDPDPAIGSSGYVLGGTGNNNYGGRLVLPSAQTTVGIGLNQWLTSIPNGPNDISIIAEWRDGSNNRIAFVYVDTTGAIRFFNRYDNTDIANSSGPVCTANAWWHFESKLTCSSSGLAEVEVRVNGITKLQHSGFSTGIATGSGAVGASSQIIINKSNAVGHSANARWKNIVIWDGSGTRNNDFLGSVTVFFQPVDSDISLGGWTCSSGASGSALIGHAGPPVDANYIAADDTPPAPAEFTMTDLPPDVTSVRYIIPIVRAAKVDGGDGNIQVSISPDGVNYDTGPNTPITSAMTYWGNAAVPFVSELDPATSAPWTPSGFNSARVRIDRTV